MATQNDAATERIGGTERAAVELLDVKAVATLLGCSARHVYRLADAGRMPHPIKLGQLVRWRRAGLMDWLAADCPSVRSAKGATR